ncbi:MAG: glycosyltransferase family 2 protein [Candidatus Nanopelagicaceae bacterium]|jgi:succinoglycan biosynthesis protein ExoA
MVAVNYNANAVSVILPVLNEEHYLEHSVNAILQQDFSGEIEVVLAIGPSQDKTHEIAAKLVAKDSRIILVENPTGKTAAGLNLAIKNSHHPIIVRVDGHANIPRNYISIAVNLLKETEAVNVGGIMAAEGVTEFEKAVAGAMRSPLGVGGAKFHTGGSAGYVDTVYLGVFNREALIAAGGFDERFTRAQDWELNFRLRKNGGKIYFDPRLTVTYRPRRSISALAKQYFEYGRWRRVVTRTHKGTINYRYLAPPLAVIANLFSIIGAFISPWLLLPLAIYLFFLLIAAPLIGKSPKQICFLPLVLFTMQMSWGVGFITSRKALISS